MNKTITLLVLLCAAAPLVASGASPQPAAPTNAAVTKPAVDNLFTNLVAKGKGIAITQSDLDEEYLRVKSVFAQQNRPPPSEAQVLDSIINKQLILALATDADKAKGKESFEAMIKRIKTAQKISEEEFNKSLGMQLMLTGLTRDQWEKQNIEQHTLPLVVEREVKVTATEDEAKAYFAENSASFEHPETARMGHILFLTRDQSTNAELPEDKKAAKKKLAEAVLKRAQAGEDFAKLAKENSDDPAAKDTGGELTISPGMLQNLPQMEAAIFALKTNQVSELIPVPYGYHIAKLYEKTPAKKETYAGLDTKTVFTKPDGDTASVRDVLVERARQKLIKGYLQQLQKNADVQILDEKLKVLDEPEPVAAPAAAGATPPAAKSPATK
jgi:parvulin-like peptidyl-prolyl isomerase